MDDRLARVLIAVAGCVGSLASAALMAVLDGRTLTILKLPLALVFFSGMVVLISCALELIFGERGDGAAEPTRLEMLFVAACAAMVCAVLLVFASALDKHAHAIAYELRFLAAATVWLVIGCLLGAIFGKLPDMEMAEGD